jgi:hypothetical protein
VRFSLNDLRRLLLVLALLTPAPAFAQSSWLYEICGSVLAHDVPIVAGGK